MTEKEPRPNSPIDKMYRDLDRLFTEHADLLAPSHQWGNVRYDDLAVAIPQPREIGTSPNEHTTVQDARLDPWVFQRMPAGDYLIRQDDEADMNAALTRADKERIKRIIENRGEESLLLYRSDPDAAIRALYRLRRGGTFEERQLISQEIEPHSLSLLRWQAVVELARPYDPRTHGILRARRLSNGLALEPDRIATHQEIATHKRQIWLENMPSWRRLFAKLLERF